MSTRRLLAIWLLLIGGCLLFWLLLLAWGLAFLGDRWTV